MPLPTKKILNIGLIFSSLLGYLEWGSNRHTFLFQAEFELLRKLPAHPESVIHPFILIPLAGQLILLFTLFQKEPGKKVTYAGMAFLSLLILLISFIGLLQANWKMLASTIPFLLNAFFVMRRYQRN